jgi:hypothetical protein
MKPKVTQPINVLEPVIGASYQFEHAGSTHHVGKLVGENKALTEHYGVRWFNFSVPGVPDPRYLLKPDAMYPCSIYNIIKSV